VISSPFFFFKKMSLPFPAATSSSSSFHQRAVQLWRVTIKFFEKGNASSFGCSVWRIYIASRRRRFRRAAAEQKNERQDEIRLSSRRFLMWRNVGKCCCTSA
jgi:hypothetical protein